MDILNQEGAEYPSIDMATKIPMALVDPIASRRHRLHEIT